MDPAAYDAWYASQRGRWNSSLESFHCFVLDQGERLLAEQFGGSVPVS